MVTQLNVVLVRPSTTWTFSTTTRRTAATTSTHKLQEPVVVLSKRTLPVS